MLESLLSNVSLFDMYIPLGVIGLWRWSVWGFKKIISSFYKPIERAYSDDVSIVTPVYNENPEVFLTALKSWQTNQPKEIIAVIDYTDKQCIGIFKEFSKYYTNATLLITKTPGKREALADGIKKAKSEIVALVDCDTIWAENVLQEGLKPFSNPRVGGVATKQEVLNPRSLAQKTFSILLNLRYSDDLPFLSASGPYLRCLSGRTAFYRRQAILPLLNDLITETFMGQKVISGDDKRLTYTLQAAGWHTYYQSTARVFTPGMQKFSDFMKQKIRWTRNSWREDISAFFKMGFIRKSPVFLVGFVDSAIQPFTLLLSPLFFLTALVNKHWLPAMIIVLWWIVSRTIKLSPHLKKYPKDIVLVPFYIPFSFYSGLIKIYSLVSLNTQGWITRWDKTRLIKFTYVQRWSQYALTTILVLFISIPVLSSGKSYVNEAQLVNNPRYIINEAENLLEVSDHTPIVAKHIVESGEDIITIAKNYNVNPSDLVKYNFNILPNWNILEIGTVLTIPLKNNNYEPSKIFNYERAHLPYNEVIYDATTNSLNVSGRGSTLTLQELAEKDGYVHIISEGAKNWLVTSNIIIESGVSLAISGDEVAWLKLKSDGGGFVRLASRGGRLYFNNVKVTSWDQKLNTVDNNYQDGRAYILAQGDGRLDIYDSEMAYLGYKKDESLAGGTYGVSWRIPSRSFGKYFMTGEVINSKFHNNYFGAYTYGASGMLWKGNQFFSNVQYGLDPHDDSNNFLVENNLFFNNGSHGLIFSKRCYGNYIINNASFYNKLHGIMLHEKSNENHVKNNYVFGNHDGIAIYDSSSNYLTSNTVFENVNGIRANLNSKNNVFSNNRVMRSSKFGFYFYSNSRENSIKTNYIAHNERGVYLKNGANSFVNNTILENRYGVYMLKNIESNGFKNNDINNNKYYNVYLKNSNSNKEAKF